MKYFLLLYEPRINNSLKTRRVNSAWHDTESVSYLGPKIGNHFHNISRLFDVLPNFLFPTSETMRYKHGVYELPHELPNYVRFRILGSHCPRQVPAALALAPTREKKIQDPRKLGNFKNVSKLPTIIV